MHFATFVTLFAAAAVLGVPTEPTEPTSIASLTDDVFDQGDGFYLASYNEAGTLDVDFTPIAELDTASPAEQLTTRGMHTLNKRETVCSGRSSVALATLDAINVQLAQNADGQRNYGAGSWGWVSFLFAFNKHIIIITTLEHRSIEMPRLHTSAITPETT
jgi:hypothetical protein